MKLYTEEEIVSFLKKEFADEINAETFMENLTPIELPSDEEISEESYDVFGKESRYHVHILQYKAFKRGAKWMRDKIQGSEQ
jgi:hypothetical protein